MEKTLLIMFVIVLITIWIGLLIPQYSALKNKHYRSVAILMCAFLLSIGASVALFFYGGFPNLLDGKELPSSSEVNEVALCILGVLSELGLFFCLWFVYFRKTWDYTRVNGYSDKQIRAMMDPEIKRLLGLPQ